VVLEPDVFIGSAQVAIIGKRILQDEVRVRYQAVPRCKK
jgi:hypothetical protein